MPKHERAGKSGTLESMRQARWGATKTFASLSWAPLFKRVTDQLLVLLFLLDPGFLHSHGHVLQMRT